MDPIAATQEAVDEHGPFTYQGKDLLLRLAALAEEIQHRVPSCVGLSLSLAELDVTFTFVATEKRVAVLDAAQYVDGGPCVEAIQTDSVVAFTTDDGAGGQDRWPLFSRASAASGVASTLSLPLATIRQGEAVGGFNLYADERAAFDGRHEELAQVLGAWAGGAVTDADLGFSTRDVAQRAPAILREATRIIVAKALLARVRGLDEDEAERRLKDAAVRAGVPLDAVVDTVIGVLGAVA